MNDFRKKITEFIKKKKRKFNRINKKIENKNQVIQNQAEDISFLIKNYNFYKEKCTTLQKQLREEKAKNKKLMGEINESKNTTKKSKNK